MNLLPENLTKSEKSFLVHWYKSLNDEIKNDPIKLTQHAFLFGKYMHGIKFIKLFGQIKDV